MPLGNASDRRVLLRRMYEAAVAAAHPASCVPGRLPPAPEGGRIIVVGAGKAAAAMAVATEQHYLALGRGASVSGSVVTRYGARLESRLIEITEAGHPVPDAASVAAARRALDLAAGAGAGDVVLCLLSGGASALWTAPGPGLDLAAKQQLTRELLRAGARISEINTVRRHLSAIKGGRLAAAAWPARLVTLAMSDVPGDDPATIGSGPTVADATTLADARAVIARYGIDAGPQIGRALVDAASETVKPGARELASASYALVATPSAALEAAAAVGRSAGYAVEVLSDRLEGEARDVAAEHAGRARAALARSGRCAILSGGELTVTVRGTGSGGPNQEYALALAIALDGAQGVAALAADTDGIDGGGGASTDPAGAIIDATTLERARALNLNAANFLANNDSTGFFSALGDLVRCGATQTNVNDLRAILVDPEQG